MRHQPKNFWTIERVAELRKMIESGVSLNRAAIRLKRTKAAVQNKAREIGLAFRQPQPESICRSEGTRKADGANQEKSDPRSATGDAQTDYE